MAKPEIIGSARSTYTRVVRMVCEEKGIDYTLNRDHTGLTGASCHSSLRQNAGIAPRPRRAV